MHDDGAVQKLVAAINNDLPQPFQEWPGGWPDEIEAALIDAVLTIQAKYGQPHNGVRGAVARYRREQTEPLNSLSRLAQFGEPSLRDVLGVSQKTSGRSKAGAIIEAASALQMAGVEKASDLAVGGELDPQAPDHKKAYTGVHGLGSVTWSYFTMLLGKPDIKADTWIIRWVSQAIGAAKGDVSSTEAHRLLKSAHEKWSPPTGGTKPNLTQLDHAIWSHARST